jgi:hypothetical protein
VLAKEGAAILPLFLPPARRGERGHADRRDHGVRQAARSALPVTHGRPHAHSNRSDGRHRRDHSRPIPARSGDLARGPAKLDRIFDVAPLRATAVLPVRPRGGLWSGRHSRRLHLDSGRGAGRPPRPGLLRRRVAAVAPGGTAAPWGLERTPPDARDPLGSYGAPPDRQRPLHWGRCSWPSGRSTWRRGAWLCWEPGC